MSHFSKYLAAKEKKHFFFYTKNNVETFLRKLKRSGLTKARSSLQWITTAETKIRLTGIVESHYITLSEAMKRMTYTSDNTNRSVWMIPWMIRARRGSWFWAKDSVFKQLKVRKKKGNVPKQSHPPEVRWADKMQSLLQILHHTYCKNFKKKKINYDKRKQHTD